SARLAVGELDAAAAPGPDDAVAGAAQQTDCACARAFRSDRESACVGNFAKAGRGQPNAGGDPRLEDRHPACPRAGCNRTLSAGNLERPPRGSGPASVNLGGTYSAAICTWY